MSSEKLPSAVQVERSAVGSLVVLQSDVPGRAPALQLWLCFPVWDFVALPSAASLLFDVRLAKQRRCSREASSTVDESLKASRPA